MKKKVLALTAALMLFAGVASGSSINGEYKGNPIIKIKSNGKQVADTAVPAMLYEDTTMIPIAMLRQLGVTVAWNTSEYSVDVTLPSSTNTPDYTPSELAEVLEGDVSFVSLMSDGKGFYQIHFITPHDILTNTDAYQSIMAAAAATNYMQMKITDKNNTSILLNISTLKNFFAGKITNDDLIKSMKVEYGNASAAPSTSSYSQPITQQPSQSSSQATKEAVCTNINNTYNEKVAKIKREVSAFNGKQKADVDAAERERALELQIAGCK
jgi:hypothetical protein